MNNKVYVAKLGKAVGLKGHVKLFIDSDFPEQFQKGATFTTNKKETLIVEEFNPQRGIIKFETINDMDSAKKLTNSTLFTTYEQTKVTCELEENQYFWFDLVDCDVIDDEENLGKVKEIHRYPSSDYLEVTTSSALVEKGLPKTFLIPYIEEYVVNVDVTKKEITTQGAYDILENS